MYNSFRSNLIENVSQWLGSLIYQCGWVRPFLECYETGVRCKRKDVLKCTYGRYEFWEKDVLYNKI